MQITQDKIYRLKYDIEKSVYPLSQKIKKENDLKKYEEYYKGTKSMLVKSK